MSSQATIAAPSAVCDGRAMPSHRVASAPCGGRRGWASHTASQPTTFRGTPIFSRCGTPDHYRRRVACSPRAEHATYGQSVRRNDNVSSPTRGLHAVGERQLAGPVVRSITRAPRFHWLARLFGYVCMGAFIVAANGLLASIWSHACVRAWKSLRRYVTGSIKTERWFLPLEVPHYPFFCNNPAHPRAPPVQ